MLRVVPPGMMTSRHVRKVRVPEKRERRKVSERKGKKGCELSPEENIY